MSWYGPFKEAQNKKFMKYNSIVQPERLISTSIIFPESLKNLHVLNTYLEWKEDCLGRLDDT